MPKFKGSEPQSPGMPQGIGVKEMSDRGNKSYGESRAGIAINKHNMDGNAASGRQVSQGKSKASIN